MMPAQLQRSEFRFCLVRKHDKKAFEPGWQTGRAHDDKILAGLLRLGANYGVITKHGGLAVLDLDHEPTIPVLVPQLPPTFTVKTRKGVHLYYVTDADATKIVLDDGTTHHGELQAGAWFYVVGPGSTHPSGAKYAIARDLPIATVPYEDLRRALAPFVKEKERPATTSSPRTRRELELDLRIEDVIHLPRNPWRGPHPFHGSETGHNFSVAGDRWFCFRHNVGGGPLQLLAIKEGIIDCSQAGRGALRGQDFLATIGSLSLEAPHGR